MNQTTYEEEKTSRRWWARFYANNPQSLWEKNSKGILYRCWPDIQISFMMFTFHKFIYLAKIKSLHISG